MDFLLDILYCGNQKLKIKLFAASNSAQPPLRHQNSGSGVSNKSFMCSYLCKCVCEWWADQQYRRFCTFLIIVAITPIADCSRRSCWSTHCCCHCSSWCDVVLLPLCLPLTALLLLRHYVAIKIGDLPLTKCSQSAAVGHTQQLLTNYHTSGIAFIVVKTHMWLRWLA